MAAEARAWPKSASRGEVAVTLENAPLQALAVACDASSGASFELSGLWQRLAANDWRIRDTFESGSRLYVVVEEIDPRHRPRRDGGLAMIEQVVLGRSSKVVAIDRHVTDSTVACAIRHRLRRMGLSCKVRAFPLILVMAARAARLGDAGRVTARLAPLAPRSALLGRQPATRSWVISVEHPDFRLPEELSEAERSVLLHVLDGKSYGEVAAARRTSRRTVANQLASVFRKLGVSGYGETLDLLMSRALGTGSSAPLQVLSRPQRVTVLSSFGARPAAPPH